MSLLSLHELDPGFRVAVQIIIVASLLMGVMLKVAIPLLRDLWDLADERRERRQRRLDRPHPPPTAPIRHEASPTPEFQSGESKPSPAPSSLHAQKAEATAAKSASRSISSGASGSAHR
jgi:hypothetical protein